MKDSTKDKWKQILGHIAPGIGTAIGGPFGAIAGKMLGNVLLKDGKEPTDENLSEALLNATPEQLLEVKKIDKEFILQMKALEVDIFKTEIADKASARELFKTNYWPQVILTCVLISLYGWLTWWMLAGKVAESLKPEVLSMAQIIVGVLTTSVTNVVAFWFGSSFGSKEKTIALANSKPDDGNKRD